MIRNNVVPIKPTSLLMWVRRRFIANFAEVNNDVPGRIVQWQCRKCNSKINEPKLYPDNLLIHMAVRHNDHIPNELLTNYEKERNSLC